MALVFNLKKQERTVPVVIDGTEYGAKAGSSKAVAALGELGRAMGALGELSKEDMDAADVDAALKAVEGMDGTLRGAVAALFGQDAVAGIVGDEKADVATCIAVTQMLTAVINSDEYLRATAECVAERAKVAGED